MTRNCHGKPQTSFIKDSRVSRNCKEYGKLSHSVVTVFLPNLHSHDSEEEVEYVTVM